MERCGGVQQRVVVWWCVVVCGGVWLRVVVCGGIRLRLVACGYVWPCGTA